MVEAAPKKSAPLPSAALCVGREAELARLRSLYDRATRLGGHCVVVQGASGVGKSRLVQEFKRRARLDGIPVLEGRCLPDRGPYQPVLDMVREASSFLADMAPAAFDASLSVELLESLAGRGGGEEPQRSERWQNERTALYESVGELLASVDRVRPPLLLLHDVQLADEDTLSLLSYLLSTLSVHRVLRRVPVERSRFNGLFVLVERLGGTSAPVSDQLLSGVSSTRLPLSGLDRAGVEAFLASPTVVDRFIEVTGGNPRHIEALLQAQPHDADRLFVRRVARLPDPAPELVYALAVLGRPAAPRVLAQIAGLSSRKLGAVLERLLRSDLLESTVREGSLEVAFRSTADQEAVIAALAPERLEQLHRAAGQHMLASGEVVAAAEHFLSAAGHLEPDVAAVVVEAGEQLELALAYDRAIDLYDRLRGALLGQGQDVQEVEGRLCDLLELTGDYGRAVDLAQRLAERCPRDGRLRHRVGHLYLQQGDFARAREELSRALALFGAADVPLSTDRALVLCDLAEAAYLLGDRPETERLVDAILGQPPLESPLPQIKARNTLGKVYLERGDFAAAERTFRQNLAAARDAEIIPEEIRALINSGIAHLRAGDLAAAAERYRAGLAAAEASQDYRHRAYCLQNLGVLAHWRRDYTSALQLFHDAIQTFLKLDHKTWLAWIALDLGDLYLEIGARDRAEQMLSLSQTLVERKDDTQTQIFARLLRGKLAGVDGQWETARREVESALATASAARRSEEQVIATLELARLHLAQSQWDDALDLAAQAEQAANTRKARAEARLVAGEAHLGLGADHPAALPAARDALRKARDAFAEVGDLQGEWNALALLAQVAERTGDQDARSQLVAQGAAVEQRIRRSVPADLLASYLEQPRRRQLLATLGTLPEPPRAANQWIAAPSEPFPAEAAAEDTAGPVAAQDTPEAAAADTAGPVAAQDTPEAAHREEQRRRYPRILGESEPLLRVLNLVDRIAPVEATVLIRGESGTGKELIAEAIHQNSARAGAPYVTVNCGALVESLLLSELFGHERGAFTGATRRKKGRFELANGGTLFLDEIGDITPKTQVALLRVLQEKEFQRVGGTQSIRVDVRIVCATNRDLEAMVREGTFREDLYYRLKSVQVEIPPLRERGQDVVLLAQAWLDRLAEEGECPRLRLHPDATQLLRVWRWPGNVRELQNVLRSASLLAEGDVIHGKDLLEFLPPEARRSAPVTARWARTGRPEAQGEPASASVENPTPSAASEPVQAARPAPDNYAALLSEGISLHAYKKKIEAECIAQALRQSQGNITRAAALLKMKRPRLSQLVKEYGLLK